MRGQSRVSGSARGAWNAAQARPVGLHTGWHVHGDGQITVNRSSLSCPGRPDGSGEQAFACGQENFEPVPLSVRVGELAGGSAGATHDRERTALAGHGTAPLGCPAHPRWNGQLPGTREILMPDDATATQQPVT